MSLPPIDRRYDVIIAGARCAGAATALLLARHGVRVLVVDPLPLGRDTLSTHALMRGGVLQLRRWGLLDALRATDTQPVRWTTFDYADEALSIPIKSRDGIDALYAPRRTVLDPMLVRAATAAGARFVHGLAVSDVIRTGSRVAGVRVTGRGRPDVEVRADLVIGADGLRSRVARLVGAPTERSGRHRTATIYGYWKGLPADGYRWCFRDDVSIGCIPTGGGETCVFVTMPSHRFADTAGTALPGVYRNALRSVDPALAASVGDTPVDRLRAFPGMAGHLRRAHGPGWALVGDAGFFRDPLTAHGITDALRDAELLARAVLRGRDRALAGYQAARDSVALDILDITDRIASFGWSTDEVKTLHHELSRAMNAGVDLVRSFDDDAQADAQQRATGRRSPFALPSTA